MKLVFLFLFVSTGIFAQDYLRYSKMINDLQIDEKCKESLDIVYSKGGDLYSAEIAILGKKLMDYNESTIYGKRLKHYYFFHYTNYAYSNQDTLLRDQDIFTYYKKRDLSGFGYNSFGASLYISNDPYSSREFGKYLVRLRLSPDTVILHQKDFLAINWDKIENHLPSEIRQNCRFEELKPIIVEDSGIDVVKYVNYYGDDLWLQLLNSRSVLESKFTKKPYRLKRGYRKNDYNYDQ